MKYANLLRKGILAWLFAVLLEYLALTPELRDLAALEGISRMSMTGLLGKTVAMFGILLLLSRIRGIEKAERWLTLGIFLMLTVLSLSISFTWGYLGACVLIGMILVVYVCYGWNNSPEQDKNPPEPKPWHLRITVFLSCAVFLFVCVWTVGRIYSFSAPTYDFGIFSQMFYNMRKTGLPMTTVERDGLLSHFAVHVSPIYYLMLPFYWLFPCPATLQVLQAAVVVSAVIPLWKLGAHHGLSGFQRMLLCAVLLFYPAYTGGTSYDLHENCFLTPLLLWLFYGLDRKSGWITAVAALLTLMVKEDAAVYVAVIGLYLIVRGVLQYRERHDLAIGSVLLAASLVWFALVTGYLAQQGDGVMTYRYRNFMYDGSASLFTVVKAVLLNPMKAVFECVDPEKLEYIAMTLLPILGLPLMTRRYERYLLLIPYVLVNLMSDYTYQHSIWFQYNFGPIAFLMYLLVVNLSEWRMNRMRSLALTLPALVCGICFCTEIIPTAIRYPQKAIENFGQYQEVRETLAEIPEDVAVSATTFHSTFLSEREILYDVGYATRAHVLESEYVVLDLTRTSPYRKYASSGQDNGLENLIKLLEQHGFEMWKEIEGTLLILKNG